jgi:hypothetical protein
MSFISDFLTQRPNRYFWPGMRLLVKSHSAFACEIALEQGMNFVKTCGVGGDYVEFGVFQGRTFMAACHLARERGLDMQLWAFDSFEGLPDNEGEFHSGGYRCDLQSFKRNLNKFMRKSSRIHIVPGWFSDSLKDDNPDLKPLRPVAMAWIDCDLYQSAVPVLNFLTHRVQDGTLLFFDDWFNFKGRHDCGEQRACNEWLLREPQITFTEYSRFGWHGKSFIVRLAS